MEKRSKKARAFPERSGDVPGGSRARIIDFSMVLGGLGRRGAVGVSSTRYGRGLWSGPLNPKIKPNTLATGTGLGCLVPGLSPVHGPGMLGVWPPTNTGAWP